MNHLPIITALRVDGEDAFDRLRELLADPEGLGDEPIHLPTSYGDERGDARVGVHASATSLEHHKVKFALFERFGVLPGAGDRHLVEFFPGFLTEESDWGKRWGVELTTIADREGGADRYKDEFAKMRASTEVPNDAVGRDGRADDRLVPARQAARTSRSTSRTRARRPTSRPTSWSRRWCTADGDGLHRPRPRSRLPPVLAEWLRRIVGRAGGDGRGRDLGRPRQGGRGDAARPARRAHRLRPRRADDRRDARRHRARGCRSSRASRELHGRRADACASSTTSRALARDAAADAAGAIRAAIDERGEANVMLATGNSQLAFLAELVDAARHRLGRACTAFHMDEYVGLAADASGELPALHARAGRGAAAGEGVPLPRRATPAIPRPRPTATPRCCAPIRSISAAAGIGENGHLAFNDPPVADFDDPRDVKIVALEPASRRQQVGEGHFATIDDVPDARDHRHDPRARSRRGRVLAIVPEARKARAGARRAVRTRSRTACPASYPAPAGERDAVPRRRSRRRCSTRDQRRAARRTRATRRCCRSRTRAELRAPAAAARRRAVRARASRSRSRCAPGSASRRGTCSTRASPTRTGISFGVVVVLVGLVVLLAWIPLRQRLGLGTVLNTLVVGFIANLGLDLIPEQHTLATRIAMLLGLDRRCSASAAVSTSARVSGPGRATA